MLPAGMPTVLERMRWLTSRVMMTLMPERVVKPDLPRLTPPRRITLPLRRMTKVCRAPSTVMTWARPTVKPVLVSATPQPPLVPALTPASAARTVTLVLPGQNCRGRNSRVEEDSQPHDAAPIGFEVVTVSADCTAARPALLLTGRDRVTTTGLPTPTVRPLLGLMLARST